MPAEAQPVVLVVDDDERFAITLASALARRGYLAHVSHAAASALKTAQAHEPDAAIVDLKLGADDGLALVGAAAARASAHAHHRAHRLREHRAPPSKPSSWARTTTSRNPAAARPLPQCWSAATSQRREDKPAEAPLETMSPRRLEWEHIQRARRATRATSRRRRGRCACIAARCSASSAKPTQN